MFSHIHIGVKHINHILILNFIANTYKSLLPFLGVKVTKSNAN